jgi:hypothetical protein
MYARHCDGGMYARPPYERQGQGRVRVEYDDETILQDHPGKDLLPIARIRPDVCSEGGDGGVGRGLGMPADGEEDKDDPSSKWSAHVAKAGIEFRRHMESPSLPAPPNLLDTLLALGEYTTIVDVIYNHYDRFGNLAGKLIENKMAVHRGPPSLSFSSKPVHYQAHEGVHTGVFPFTCPACGGGYDVGAKARACCAVGAACRCASTRRSST